ncbi:hypothetical protein KUL25_02480 [Rhodobacteraceae bacterium N5(2021)]|uniref:asparagine synthase (glutamine-hydrolyzing) n=1 Tax=Gymnodinialimonas phycosphaerae TaxID=2841589 RepID=A0A975TVG2_9RHOB|nr:asparagine synthase-related protein [Gymnodinialimonas phycosphaerae]MBY4891628.1 hypothetical protein [Gymnodinialimonas phycosphaerae]
MFACIFVRAARANPQDHATPEALLHALTPFEPADVQGHWSNEHLMMVQALTWNTPEQRFENAPEVCATTGRVIVSWVRLDNRTELCAALHLRDAPDLTDPQIILSAHQTWGEGCVDQLEGDFSFVLYNPEKNNVFCARDSLGTRPFYYVLTDEVFVAATSLVALRALRTPFKAPSQKWIALFVANMNWAQTEAAYEGVSKLAPAHHMTVARDASTGPKRYFNFDLSAPHATRRDPIWVERYRDLFDRVVKDRARSAYLVGAESSAGLDSSSIVAQLVRVLPHDRADFHCFGMMQMVDEVALLPATSAMCDIRHTHIVTRPEMLALNASFQRALRTIGHPAEHGQMLLHPSFFTIGASLGIRTMVSGFGGDEVVTSYAGGLFDDLQAQKAYGTLLQELPGTGAMRLARLAKRLMRGASNPFERERERVRAKLAASCLRDDVLEDMGLRDQVEAWLNPTGLTPTLNAWTGLLPGFTHGRTARLESTALFAASHRVDYRFPMLDRRLIQQFFATPAIEKRHRDMGRYLHRRAMMGRVPDQILWQKTKDMGTHLGGRPNIAPRTVTPFAALPEVLRSLVDARKYDALMARCGPQNKADAPADLSSEFSLWQLDQLTAWL